ncbi:head-tail connector protein [Clostridium celatum]|uniref:Phage DNA packaging protein n=1 Tax=Clostridium celatum DSM 1785 TaxID=545697 RepID=L1QJ87_9CLOT|nr:head-tail connector protein [Clostridium celatum]EKY28079.1 phage DNA packaging protein [Clostridium celatum DSM 1785]MCE9654158.1 head-tail connector protein [Clostridium celatum]
MVVSLEEIKLYLRVDGEEEDTLISTFINVSEDLVEGILRYSVSEFEVVPEIVKQAVMYSVANMYEKREDYDAKEVIDIMTKLLFSYRKDEW